MHLRAANVDVQAEGARVTRVGWDGGAIENPSEVIWTGSLHRLCSMVGVPREELPAQLSRAHVFAVPSVYEGGPGFVYLR